jgi:hypothetical protein
MEAWQNPKKFDDRLVVDIEPCIVADRGRIAKRQFMLALPQFKTY